MLKEGAGNVLCELFHCLAQNRHVSSFVVWHMFRNWGEFMVSENKMDRVMLLTFVVCHTKHCMDMHGIMCRPVPVIVGDFTHPLRWNQFLLLNNECVVCCSCVHPVKVPVQKIQFCFTTSIVEYVNLICLTVTAGVAVVLHVLAVTQATVVLLVLAVTQTAVVLRVLAVTQTAVVLRVLAVTQTAVVLRVLAVTQTAVVLCVLAVTQTAVVLRVLAVT